MKFKIPFAYHAMAVPPGKRKRHPLSFYDELEVDVQEARMDDAPVVARWSVLGKYSDEITSVTLRMLSGRLYRQRTVMDAEGSDFAVRLRDLVSVDILDRRDIAGEDARVLRTRMNGRGTLRYEECRDHDACDRDAMAEKIRIALADVLVLDGEVWEAAMAPVVVIDLLEERTSRYSGDTEIFTDRNKLDDWLSETRGEWDNPPVAVGIGRPELLAAVRSLLDPDEAAFLPVWEIEEIPGHLCGADFEEDIAASCKAALWSLPNDLDTYEDRVITAWMRLRSAVGELAGQIASPVHLDDAVDEALGAWQSLTEQAGIEPGRRLRLLSEIWDSREIAPAFGFQSGPTP